MRAKVRGLSPDPIAATAIWYVSCFRHATQPLVACISRSNGPGTARPSFLSVRAGMCSHAPRVCVRWRSCVCMCIYLQPRVRLRVQVSTSVWVCSLV